MVSLSQQQASSSNERAREHLLTQHFPLVHHAARSLHRRLSTDASLDDLVSAGSIGLINAADNFDASRGLAFSTFALPRIRGAMLDDLRSQDCVPRSARRKARALNAAREMVSQRTTQRPDDRAVATELNVKVDAVWQWDADLAAAQHVSFDALPDEDANGRSPWQFASDAQPADESVTREETAAELRRAIEQLPPRERQILALYYYEELTQQQVAQILGVTESRVSQIRSQAVARLRTIMRTSGTVTPGQ